MQNEKGAALEPARPEELETCYAIIDSGREFQKEQGFVQWTEDYPSREIILADIERGKGFVLKAEGRLAAYLCIDFDGEPAYREIKGAWRSEEPYATVHRMAFAREFRGKGLADAVFRLAGELCLEKGVRYMRADTDYPNERMQHVLKKNGFVLCGEIFYQGGGRLAYDKML